jgi:hypothetical protein
MNALKTYWLSRTMGATPEGPFTFGQLKAMYKTGAINAEAQVCVNGEEDWTEARWMLEEVEQEQGQSSMMAPPKTTHTGKAVRKRMNYGGCGLLILSLIIAVYSPLFGGGLFLLALAVDFTAVKMVCSLCGNEVLKSSRECPACKSRLR